MTKKQPLPSKEERTKQYLPLILQGLGYRRIAKTLGYNHNTVKSDLQQLKKQADTPHPTPPPSPNTPKDITPHNTPQITPKKGKFDWSKNMDKAGQIVMGLFGQTIRGSVECNKCGNHVEIGKDHELAMKWMDRFSRLYMAKLGAIRIDASRTIIVYGELSLQDKERIRAEVVRELFREYRETGVCPMCDRPMDDVIDVDPVVE